jgi:hypothetical protein
MKAINILVAASALALGTTAIAQSTTDGTTRLTGQERAAEARAKAAERKATRERNPNAATPAVPATRANPTTGTPAIRATPAVPAKRATGTGGTTTITK